MTDLTAHAGLRGADPGPRGRDLRAAVHGVAQVHRQAREFGRSVNQSIGVTPLRGGGCARVCWIFFSGGALGLGCRRPL